MRNYLFHLVLAVLAMAVSASAEISREESNKRLLQIDRNKNGLLEQIDIDLGFWYRVQGGKFDLKAPPSPEDVTRLGAENPVFRLLKAEFLNDHKDKLSYTYDELKADLDFRLPEVPPDKPKEKPVVPPTRFLLRRSLEKIPAVLAEDDEIAKSMNKDAAKLMEQGALFSYGKHLDSGSDEWLAEGVFAYEVPFQGGLFGETALGRWMFSAGFSRIDFGGEGSPQATSPRFKNESNLFVPGVTYESLINWPQGIAGLTGSSLRLNALWKTDWDFESQIPLVELEWSLLNGRWGMASMNTTTIPNLLYWRVDATFHADIGHVSSDGKWTKSRQGDTFAHIGPKIGLTLMPLPRTLFQKSNPFVLNLFYAQYGGLTSESRETRAASAEVSWYLRKSGSGKIGPIDPGIALTLSYRHNDDIENQADDNSIILGLGVGF